MTCRDPTNTVTCSGAPAGAVMTYDAERRLATWQNTPSNPTSTASYWYDGEGHRVAQTYNGTTTFYLGDDEELTGSTLLKYYHIPGLPVLGTIVGVTRTYLASDGLGSETVDLAYNGSVLATALYGPYGVGRYATGAMPSSKGYTGQRQDSGSGLAYYNARYYDASVGQFTSADTLPDVNPIVFGGEPGVGQLLLKNAGAQPNNRYAYVVDNPETAIDPTGRRSCDEDGTCVVVKPTDPAGSSDPTNSSSVTSTPLTCDTGLGGLDCERAFMVQADAQQEAGVFGFPAVVGGGLAGLQAIVVQYLERHGLQAAIDWLAHNFVGEFVKMGLAVTAFWSAFAGIMFYIEGFFTPLDSLKDKAWVKQYFGWWKHAVNIIGTTVAGAGIGVGIGTDGGALLDPQYWAFFGGGTLGAVGVYAILQEQENRQLSEYNKVPEGLVSCQDDPGATVCSMV